jgi:hypothetical protein
MTKNKSYELWPALTPKPEDVEIFQRAIEREKAKRRVNWSYIKAAPNKPQHKAPSESL